MSKLEDYRIEKDQAYYLVTIECRAYVGNNVYNDVTLDIYVTKDIHSIDYEKWDKLFDDYVRKNVPNFASYSIKLKEINKSKKDELKQILNSYKWIKIDRFDPKDLTDVNSPMDLYNKLEKHHTEETTFLINKCRELAKELLNYMERA